MEWTGRDRTGQDRIGVLTNHGMMIRRRYTVPNTGTSGKGLMMAGACNLEEPLNCRKDNLRSKLREP